SHHRRIREQVELLLIELLCAAQASDRDRRDHRRTGQPPATLGTNGHHGTPPGCPGFSAGIRPVGSHFMHPTHGPGGWMQASTRRRIQRSGTRQRAVGGGAEARERVDATSLQPAECAVRRALDLARPVARSRRRGRKRSVPSGIRPHVIGVKGRPGTTAKTRTDARLAGYSLTYLASRLRSIPMAFDGFLPFTRTKTGPSSRDQQTVKVWATSPPVFAPAAVCGGVVARPLGRTPQNQSEVGSRVGEGIAQSKVRSRQHRILNPRPDLLEPL